MKISIFGLGYVGAVSLACLARDGHQVIGVDIDRAKLDLILAGKTPVVEEGMVELMAQVAGNGRVSVTTDVRSAILDTEISLICVGTPSAANGSQDQAAVCRPGAADRACAGAEDRTACAGVPFDPGARHRRRACCSPILEAESSRKEGGGFPPVLPARVPARGLVDPRLRQAAVHHRRRQPCATRSSACSALFGHLPCKFIQTSVRWPR